MRFQPTDWADDTAPLCEDKLLITTISISAVTKNKYNVTKREAIHEMGVGTLQAEARKEAGITQQDFANEINLSRPMVAAIETERRRMPRDVMKKAVETLDCGFYAMEAAQEVLGEAWITKLDNMDLHRSAVREKAIEELQEVMKEIAATSSVSPPGTGQHEQLKTVLIESIDAIVCLSHFVAVYCKDYGLSWTELWTEHRRKLVERGYLKEERSWL